jgi:hypothetical protein
MVGKRVLELALKDDAKPKLASAIPHAYQGALLELGIVP